ncbi:hypothetical protein QVG61_06475 [Thiohalobacter sp. IOR34]|uniref:hypothetical protein n=1 Tax=Thiohalobacter sp. IOR34 TaxID=3057176 RepID=UPI0025B1774C|nr:hypothetical protein [Thiohalobacter sp. IOR34]WJW76726.1 hypothetical protein QVG61_06475 [Thiohalobacter sp. IOR34]
MSVLYTTTAPFWGRFCLGLLLWLGVGLSVWAGESTWVLRGTLVMDGESGYAILEPPGSGTQHWQRTGGEILPGLRLAAVYPDHAIVIDQGERRRIEFGTRLERREPPVAGAYRIDLARLPEIATRVDIIPHQQDGKVVGYYTNEVPDELRSEIGLRPGDLLKRINGVALDGSFNEARFLGMLHSGRLELEVLRQGRTVQLVYLTGERTGG